jgi:hypothetical protein
MPVEKTQKLTLIDYPDKGVNTNLDPSTQIVGETLLTIECDSKSCDNKISWSVENAGQDESSLPDDAYRIIVIEEFAGAKHVFCSWDCARRAMKDYVPPLSPREKAKIEENNAKLNSSTQTSINEAAIAAQKAIANVVAINQADGFAGETTSD